jgi:iron complex outermembrane receptor protein
MQNADGSPADDAWNTVRGGGRLDWQATGQDSVTVSGDVYRGDGKQDLQSVYNLEEPGTFVPDPISFSGGYALGRWERRLSHGDFALQTYYNRESRVEEIAAGTLHTLDFDFQHHILAGTRNDLMWGVGYRLMEDHMDAGHTPFAKRSYQDNLVSAFFEDQLTLVRNRLVLTFGSKVEHNSYTGVEMEPGLRLLWTPTSTQTVWASASRAVRMPSIVDLDLQLYLPGPTTGPLPILSLWQGTPQFQSEVLRAYETGYRRQISSRLAVDVAAFVNHYSDLESVEQFTPYVAAMPLPTLIVPFIYGNSMRGTSWGMETSITWNPARSWRLSGSHSWLNGRFRYHNPLGIPVDGMGNPDSNISLQAPRNTVDLRSAWDFRRHWSLDTTVYYVSCLADPAVPGYVTANARVARKLGELGEVSGGADNLLSPRHIEFIPTDYVGYSEIRRSAYVKMTWRF